MCRARQALYVAQRLCERADYTAGRHASPSNRLAFFRPFTAAKMCGARICSSPRLKTRGFCVTERMSLYPQRRTEGTGCHNMDIERWNQRYRLREHPDEDLETQPTPLLVKFAERLSPGSALDLACGAGRNALWLAEHGWDVTAVDGAAAAIEILQSRASERGLKIATVVADLEKGEFEIEPSRWDLVGMCYYLQRNLYESAKRGVRPGGILISIVHIAEPGEAASPHRLLPGQLEKYFAGWEILHRHEGKPNDSAHHHAVAEIVARRPLIQS
jgi:tellurite methyltransferase